MQTYITSFPVATAIFATAGISIWTFFVAAFLSLPKQFAGVYLGVQTHGEDGSMCSINLREEGTDCVR